MSLLILFGSVGILLWNASGDSRSSAAMSLGATLLAISAPAVAVSIFGVWLARRNQRDPRQ
jgi:hypothetical protein